MGVNVVLRGREGEGRNVKYFENYLNNCYHTKLRKPIS